jgi:Cof subfamily protein (haloacid dehalogenase superfamily)
VNSLKKFEGILFCTDLDGTLFRSDKAVSKRNLDAIEYFKSQGGLFTFITGRVPESSGEVFNIIKPNAPFGCINGGGIFDGVTKKYLFKETLPLEAIELIKFVEQKMPQMGIQYSTDNGVYFYKDNQAMELFRSITGLPYKTKPFDDLKDNIMKIVFADMSQEQMLELIELLDKHPKAKEFNFVRSAMILYELLPKSASKGNILLKMADMLGIDAKKTIAVGDYNNDISMIKSAGLGFAVANAVDEVKAVADYVTVSNDDDAIAVIIEDLDKGEFVLG